MLDFFKTLFANATERIKNPLIGTFLMSWIVFNWKAILFLIVSTNDIESKFETLSANYSNIWNLLGLPLFVTILYIFGLPWLNLWIDDLLYYSNEKQRKRVHKKELKTIKLKEDILIANIDLENKEKEYRELKSHNETIEGLNKEIKGLNQGLSIGRENHKMAIEENKRIIEILTSRILDYDLILDKMVILNNAMLVYQINKDGIVNDNNELIYKWHDNAMDLQRLIDEAKKYRKVLDETKDRNIITYPIKNIVKAG